ncbi:MAG: hypothetical protein ACQPRH_04115 [Solitalea-like symbiont of Tyrophagus putrescentiae]
MAIRSTMGLKKIFFAPANPTDNTQIPTTGWKDLGTYTKKHVPSLDLTPQ